MSPLKKSIPSLQGRSKKNLGEWAQRTGPSVFDLSDSARSLAGSEGPGPQNRKQKQACVSTVTPTNGGVKQPISTSSLFPHTHLYHQNRSLRGAPGGDQRAESLQQPSPSLSPPSTHSYHIGGRGGGAPLSHSDTSRIRTRVTDPYRTRLVRSLCARALASCGQEPRTLPRI